MTSSTTTSAAAIVVLEECEAVVLKAYRCPANVWTIGAGLTAASGVVTPKAGMVITKEQARDLLGKALSRNYEPRVRRALPGVAQNVFDGAVLFDFNTGAIDSASWVGAFKRGDLTDAERRFKLWNKGGGKKLQGLVNRRNKEWRIIGHGDYGRGAVHLKPLPGGLPKWVFPQGLQAVAGLTSTEDVRLALKTLGYVTDANEMLFASDVMRFQQDHDLTVDGIVGPATLATIQRRLDARRKLGQAVAGAGAGGAIEAVPATTDVPLPDGSGLIVAGIAVLIALWLLWQYRDWVAVKVQGLAPRLARKLRSF